MTPDRALAKVAGSAQRAYGPAADLYRECHDNEALPVEIRRDAVAVIEALDLMRFHIREATLANIVHDMHPPKKRSAAVKRPVAKKRKAKR